MTTSDWDLAHANLTAEPSRWGTLSWISAKALIDSVNHGLDRFSDGLVPQLRSHWVATTPAPDLRIVERPDVTSFVVIGDTGEQDASQYVVCPSLSAAVREHRPGFVLVASDVIYPAGDVDDYRDGVYRPYRSTDPHFRVEAPLLGLPGNHDWYDGLAGFMYHFADQERPPASAYAPTGRGRRAWVGRLSRILWRRAAPPRPATTALRDAGRTPGQHPLTGTMAQPGPYYAVRTKHLLLVAIDTGIDGRIDAAQLDWLRTVSAQPGPKVLVTGKPLLVNGRLDPCRVAGRGAEAGDSVWAVVNRPEHGYLATIGGDVHNFQQYRPRPEDAAGPALHLVAGGGGAFVHATHTYANADHDSRVRNNPASTFYALPERSFPSRDESFRHFAALLVPGVVRVLGHLLLFLAGGLAGGLGAFLPSGPGLAYSQVAGLVAVVALGVLVLARTVRRGHTRTSGFARRVVSVGSFAVGLLAGSAAHRLDPANFPTFLVAWLGFTGFHCVAGALIRRSRWWRPADESSQNLPFPLFALGALLLSALAYGLLRGLGPGGGAALLGGLLVFVVAWIGYRARRRRFTAPGVGELDDAAKRVLGRRNRLWHRAGIILVPAVQAVVIGIGLFQVAQRVGRPWLFWGGLLGVLLVLGIALLVGVALVLLTEAVTAVARAGRPRGPGTYATAWGRVSAVTHYAPIPLLAAALTLTLVLADRADSLTGRAAVGLPLVVFAVGSYLVWVVWLRPRIGAAYVPFAIGVPAVLLLLAFLADPWWARAALATAVVLVALGVSVTLGHLAFLGVQLLVVTPGGLARPTFTDEQIEAVYAARRQRPARVPAGVPKHVLLWARLTAPDLGEPGGLLQQKVAEIFSSDQPPFHKSFLRLDTTDDELQITLHQVFGDRPAATLPVGAVPLDRGRVQPTGVPG